MRLTRKYEAEAAHQLSAGVPEGHPCRRLHGHRYEIWVTIIGDINPETGMVLEYAELDKRVNEVLSFVDHRFINKLGLDCGESPFELKVTPDLVRQNSTVEYLAQWFLAELKHRFPRTDMKVGPLTFLAPQVYMVRIREDSRSEVEAS